MNDVESVAHPAVEMAATTAIERLDAVKEYILHHVSNSDSWHIPFFFHVTFEIPTFSLHALMVLIAAGLLLYLFRAIYDHNAKVPTGMTNLLETFVVFIRDDIAINFLGEEDGKRMTPLFCSFFFFILTLNLLGLVPVFASATANINVTAALAAVTFFFMTFGAIVKNGPVGFIRAFVPHGVPWPMLILLVPIEIAGVFIKSMALMIRLFANMMAGHIVISALIGLVVVYGTAALPALGLAGGVYVIKLFIAFLQAYIFTLLSAMFIGQIYHPVH